MVWRKLLAGSLMIGTLAGTAHAGGIFNRKKAQEPAKQNEAKPEDRVGDLVRVLRGDPDERRRTSAAGELAKIDFKANPQAGTALIDSLRQDPSPNVRSEVAAALGKLRPLTVQGGQALEASLDGDQSPRVRLAARNAIQVYLQNGYRVAGNRTAPPDNRANPAVKVPAQPTVAQRPTKPTPPVAKPATKATTVANRNQSSEPPLAETMPEPQTVPMPVTSLKPAKPITDTPADSTEAKPYKLRLIPKEPSVTPPAKPAAPPKPAKPEEDGPILNPPG